jgi:predicted phosphodiesterase
VKGSSLDRPSRGSPERREWVLQRVRDAHEDDGCPHYEFSLAKFRSVATSRPDEPWPCNNDFHALGGWPAIRTLALVAAEPPSTRDLADRQGVRRDLNYQRKLERQVGDQQHTAERLRDALADAVAANPPRISKIDKPRIDPATPSECETVAFVSDVHFGALIDPQEVPGGGYDWTIAARRMGLFVEQAATYKPHHRAHSRLRLLLGGDAIEGEIHGRGPHLDALASQVDGASQIFTAMIDYLRHHYARIDVECATGNHDRWAHREGRAVTQKWDGIGTTIYRGLRAIFRDCSDVAFHIPRTPYTVWKAPGGVHCALTHGDTVFHAGNPGRKVDVAKLATQTRAWNSARGRDERLEVVAVGHYHTPLVTELDDGIALLINGCGSGASTYGQSLGWHGSNPVQLLWESVPGHPVGDVRFVRLGAANASHERIVRVPEMIGDAA